MNPPHPLLDHSEESIASGTFIDTKLYAFSRRDASGHCNSRVLNTALIFHMYVAEPSTALRD